MKCYECNHDMIYFYDKEKKTHEGKDYYYPVEYYKCPECGMVFSLDNYENEVNSFVNRRIKADYDLLQSDDITRRRIACGVGKIEFWYSYLKDYFCRPCDYSFVEGGVIQTKEQDNAIRSALESMEAETKGKRVFPLRMYGYTFLNEFEPERFFWAVQKLCLNSPTSEEDIYKKLVYFDSRYNYTCAKYTIDEGNYYVADGRCFLDYMVNVLQLLKIETKDGIDYYVSENDPQYPLFEQYIGTYYYQRDRKRRTDCLDMLRRNGNLKLILTDKHLFMSGRLDAFKFIFQNIDDATQLEM